jgi:DNA-binding GntR family transcriptional regulator
VSTLRDTQVAPLEKAPPMHHGVLERLSDLIVGGVLAPGSRIVEGDLARQLGVSRGPVREALQALAREGFVDLRPRQGAFVHQPTEKEVREFFEVRCSLEVTSVELAAERMEASQADVMTTILAAAEEALERGEDPISRSGSADLHIEIAKLAGNAMLTEMLTALKRRADWYSPPFEPLNREISWREHRALVEAIVHHDVDQARRVATAHIESARDRYLMAFSTD